MTLATTRIGDGPRPTLLLHGFLGAGRNLASLARVWSQRDPSRTFVLVDLPGHGTSPALTPGTDLSVMGRAVLETAQPLGAVAGEAFDAMNTGDLHPAFPRVPRMWFHYVNPVSGRVPQYLMPKYVLPEI